MGEGISTEYVAVIATLCAIIVVFFVADFLSYKGEKN